MVVAAVVALVVIVVSLGMILCLEIVRFSCLLKRHNRWTDGRTYGRTDLWMDGLKSPFFGYSFQSRPQCFSDFCCEVIIAIVIGFFPFLDAPMHPYKRVSNHLSIHPSVCASVVPLVHQAFIKSLLAHPSVGNLALLSLHSLMFFLPSYFSPFQNYFLLLFFTNFFLFSSLYLPTK